MPLEAELFCQVALGEALADLEEDRDLAGYKGLCVWWDRVAKAVFGDVDDVDDDMLLEEITKLAEYRDVDCG